MIEGTVSTWDGTGYRGSARSSFARRVNSSAAIKSLAKPWPHTVVYYLEHEVYAIVYNVAIFIDDHAYVPETFFIII